jgi:hypothetical protein
MLDDLCLRNSDLAALTAQFSDAQRMLIQFVLS